MLGRSPHRASAGRCGWPGRRARAPTPCRSAATPRWGPSSSRPGRCTAAGSSPKRSWCSARSTGRRTPAPRARRPPPGCGPARRRSCCAVPRAPPSAPTTSSVRGTSSRQGLFLPPGSPLFLLSERLEDLPVVVPGEPGRAGIAVEQHLVQPEVVERRDVLVVEGLALVVRQFVRGHIETGAAVAALVAVHLAGAHPVVDKTVHLVPAHGSSSPLPTAIRTTGRPDLRHEADVQASYKGMWGSRHR